MIISHKFVFVVSQTTITAVWGTTIGIGLCCLGLGIRPLQQYLLIPSPISPGFYFNHSILLY